MRRSVILLKQWLHCWENLLLGAAIVLGTVMRFHGLLWDAPYFFHPDEGKCIGLTTKLSDSLNVECSYYGTVPVYLLALGRFATSSFLPPTETNLRLMGRSLSAFLGSLTIVLCYLVARKGYGKRTGVLAAFFMGCTVLHIQLSHFYGVDTFLVFFMVWALYHMIAVAQCEGRRSSLWAGLFSGLSMATKFTSLSLLFPLVAAHLAKGSLRGEDLRGKLVHLLAILQGRSLWLAIAVMLGTFFFLTPFSILDFEDYALHQGLLWNILMGRGYIRPQWTLHFEGTQPYLYYLTNLLFWAMGPLLELASIGGTIYAMMKWRKKANLVLLAFVLAYFASVGGSRVKFIRYALPMLPALNILAAAWFDRVAFAATGSKSWPLKGLVGLVAGISLLYSLAFTNIYSSPDLRIEACQWLNGNIERGVTIVLDEDFPLLRAGGELPAHRLHSLDFTLLYDRSPFGARVYLPPFVEKTGLTITRHGYFKKEGPMLTNSEKQSYINRYLMEADYVIVSDSRFSTHNNRSPPHSFQVESEFYRQLFSGQLGFELIKVFKRSPSLLGIGLDDNWAELSFRVPDHPTMWVFRRGAYLSIEPSTKTNFRFADKVLLWGYDLDTTHVNKGEVWLGLHWRALPDVGGVYWVYLKLVDGAYKVWGQQEGTIGSPMGQWHRGETVQNTWRIDVMPGTPPGDYQVEVILHDPQLGRNLEARESVLLGPVKIPQREPPALTSLDMEHPQEAILDDKIQLLGYNIESGFRPGDGIHLTLFWQCLKEMGQDYTVFTHLIDKQGIIWGQKDNPPVDGLYPTTKWQAGEIVRDQYDLIISPDAPSGKYRIEIGMYTAQTGQRLSVLDSEGQQMRDRILLGPITIEGQGDG